MSSNTADALRWVLYDGVYYVALLMSPENAPMEVPEGNVFVYFLGAESGSAVPESDVFPYDPNDEEKCKQPEAAAGVAAAAELLNATSSSPNDVTLGDLLDMDMTEAEEEAHASRKKKEKKKKVNVKQESEDDSLDEEHMHRIRNRRRDRQDEEDAEDEDELLLGGSKRKGKKSGAPLLEDGDEEEEEDEEEAAHRDDENDVDARWNNMEAAAGLRDGGRKRDSRTNAFGSMSSMSRLQQSPITPFIGRIRSVYQRLGERARMQSKILDMSEYQVLAAIESKLRSTEAKVAFLKRTLSDSSSPSEMEDDTHTTVDVEGAIHRLQEEASNVEKMVSEIVQIVSPPQLRSEVSRTEHDRRHPQAAEDNFVDPTTDHVYCRRAYAHAPLESSPQEKVNKYHDQRRRLEQQQQYSSYSQRNSSLRSGLLGRSNDVKVMENWSKARALLAIAPIQESQLVKPEGYFAAKFSSSKSRLEADALRRLTRGKGISTSSSVGEDDDDAMVWYKKQTQRAHGDGPNGAPVLYHFHDQHYLPAGGTSIGGINAGKEVDEMRYVGVNAPNTGNQNVLGMGSISAGGAASLYLSQYSEDPTLPSQDPPNNGAPAGVLPKLEVPGYVKPELLFKMDPEEDPSQKKSIQYSVSVALPSQESVYSELDEDQDEERKSRHHRHRSHSRHSSRANSVDPDDESKRHSTSSRAGGETKKRTWRDSAKRALLEQLTLYYKGIKGKPRVLDEADFKRIAALLLERATQAESERSKRSLKLEVNNRSVPFTKEMEKKLKKSVDSYMQRHFAGAMPESAISTTNLTTAQVARDSNTAARRPGQIPLPQPSMPETALDGQEEAPLTYQ